MSDGAIIGVVGSITTMITVIVVAWINRVKSKANSEKVVQEVKANSESVLNEVKEVHKTVNSGLSKQLSDAGKAGELKGRHDEKEESK